MVDLDEVEAQIDGAYDLSHLNVRVVRELIAELRELRAHPLRHLAHDRSSVVINTAAIRHDLCEHGSYYVADNDWRVCLSCGVALPVSDPQRRNGE